MSNTNLTRAKNTKNDEFYTQWADIEREVNAYLEYNPDVFRGKIILCPCDDPYESNFFKFFALHFNAIGLKKLISTCYSGSSISNMQLSLFDYETAENKTTKVPHKLIIDEKDREKYKINDLRAVEHLLANKEFALTRLKGDGDFRSAEVTALRDEADIIITNPPFSLFREFLAWIMEANKKFLIISNKNCLTYKEVFPLIKDNKLWSGRTEWSGGMWFETTNINNIDNAVNGVNYKNVPSIWLTNLDHGRRHQPLPLTTMADSLKYSKHKDFKGKETFDRYDNYDAIEVPYTDIIPSDYTGVMGVPITYLEKYCPEQFEIVGATESEGKGFSSGLWHEHSNISQALVNGQKVYKRIFIKHKESDQ